VTNGTFEGLLNGFYSLAPEAVKQQARTLYPYQGPGIPEWLRTSAFYGDSIFNCNHAWLAKAFRNSYRYVFDMPPAFHGQDFPYTFYTGPNNRVANGTAAIIHQKFITNYVIHGEPGCEQGACFPRYGSGKNALSMNVSEIKVVKDPWATERCDFLVSLMEFS